MPAPHPGSTRPAVGIAYSRSVAQFLRRHADTFDYVEIPFELLRHDPSVIAAVPVPIILHCATLSIGGTVDCSEQSLQEILGWVERTDTPWLGEHLAYITASKIEAGPAPQPYTEEPYNVGYTVSPPMNRQVLERVVSRLDGYQRRFPVPLLIENSPLYFQVPTSTMSQAEFLTEICQRSSAGLLLDLTHFYISSRTMRFDPIAELDALPLDSVVELHISGVESAGDGLWDDHAHFAPEIIYEMLAHVMKRVTPQAVTLEYNWPNRFREALLLSELERTKEALGLAGLKPSAGRRAERP